MSPDLLGLILPISEAKPKLFADKFISNANPIDDVSTFSKLVWLAASD
jgi:hypothetical protein